MIGKIVAVFATVLIVVFLLTHASLFYHPLAPVSKSQEYYYTTTTIKNMISYQFSVFSNISTKYILPLTLAYGNVTIEAVGKGMFNLTIINNSTVVYSTNVNGYFTRSFMIGGEVKLVFFSTRSIDINVSITDVY